MRTQPTVPWVLCYEEIPLEGTREVLGRSSWLFLTLHLSLVHLICGLGRGQQQNKQPDHAIWDTQDAAVKHLKQDLPFEF